MTLEVPAFPATHLGVLIFSDFVEGHHAHDVFPSRRHFTIIRRVIFWVLRSWIRFISLHNRLGSWYVREAPGLLTLFLTY